MTDGRDMELRELVQELVGECHFERCLHCRRAFLRTRTDRVYCSDRCRAMAWQARSKQK
jgi:hypothetical protein